MIPISRPHINESDLREVSNAVASGWVSSLGAYIDKFEQQFANYVSTKHCVSVCNGTVGLHLAMVALGIGPGDEVILPDITFAACANAVTYTGATPVLCDINSENDLISIDHIEKLITNKTKAILAVHLFGRPVDIRRIRKIIGDRNIYLLEDCAEAHGAELAGRRVGGLADVSVFSFYGNKIITTGEGGAVCTNSDEIATNLRILRDHGMSKTKRYWHDRVGFNYRFTNMQAALGVSQLSRIDHILEDRHRIFLTYQNILTKYDFLAIPESEPDTTAVCWIFNIVIRNITDESQRSTVIEQLKSDGIETRPTFYPISMMPIVKPESIEEMRSHRSYFKGLCLPTFFEIPESDIVYVCDKLISHLKLNMISTS
jgi:perosamine synthetase